MKTMLGRFVIALIIGCVVSGTVSSPAAKAPVDAVDLEKGATSIVVGTVVDVKSKTEKSKIETGFGIHRDKVFTIKLKVSVVLKGSGLKAGDEIELRAWRPSTRIPPHPGLQGHEAIPAKGDRVKVYADGKDGNAFKPILPNGMVIEAKKVK